VLLKYFICGLAFPLFLKQPVRFCGRFPRLNETATVKASNHSLFLLQMEGVAEMKEVTKSPTPSSRMEIDSSIYGDRIKTTSCSHLRLFVKQTFK